MVLRVPLTWIASSANSLRVRSCGPATSMTRPRKSVCKTADSTASATSSTETKLIGFSPRPKTIPRWRISAHSSTNAVALTIVHPRAAGLEVLFGGVFGARQFHRAVGGGAGDRHEHDVGA